VLQGGRGPLRNTAPLAVYTRACDQGFAAGCGSLGDVYFQGSNGVQKDQAKGRALWKDSCERGHAESCLNLGVMSHLGDGVTKDDGEAARYLARACELGQANACRLADELKGQSSSQK
jgi:TPR repeat protein